MVDTDDAQTNARAPPCQLPGTSTRKMFWRSASWSSSRTAAHNPADVQEKAFVDPDSNGQHRRFPPVPLTPRSQQNSKARSSLPPLQPLSIARRSFDEWPKAGSDDIGEWPHPPTPSGRASGERLKLDLSSIQQNSDKNVGLVKREKIAFFDKECSKVAEHIYLGGDAVAKNRDILKQNRITHVLNCVGFVCPEYFQGDFVYRTLWLQDSPTEDITSILYDVFDYFEDVREQGGRVFVHCCQGVSRSTSLVIAYLMWREGQSFDDAFQYVKAARGIADPNMGFACQLLQCQKRVHAFPLSPSSLLRMYRIAPHSPYDPLHLVPKMLNDPSPSALDSRGTFIVHSPSAIYLWIGKNCEPIMERDARGAVGQIVRYEKVKGSIMTIKEGEEPDYFWNAFSNLLPLMDKSGNGGKTCNSDVKVSAGQRKVDLYDVDFEVFQKAIMGGFVPPFAASENENENETHLPARESSWSDLRRKFASSDMKEFVSAPKFSFPRAFSDSMMLVHSSRKFSPSSSSSSSSSPPYLSPDSISTDSSNNSKYFSESSLDSPSAVSCSHPASSLSNFSNLSLISRRCSTSIPNNAEIHNVDLTSQTCSPSVSSSSKRISPSLAERRGSLSKSLKLPLVTDKTRVRNSGSNFLSGQEDYIVTSSIRSDPEVTGNKLQTEDHFKYGEVNLTPEHELDIFPAGVTSSDTLSNKDSSNKDRCEASLGDSSLSSALKEIDGSDNIICNLSQILVFRWPSLEKLETFRANDINSEAAFLIFSPSMKFEKNEERVLYFWIGKSFSQVGSQVRLDSTELGNPEVIEKNLIGCKILTQMGLPEDTIIKIVKENEEPVELRALLSML